MIAENLLIILLLLAALPLAREIKHEAIIEDYEE